MTKHRHCKGFSFLELTISIAIIALIVAAITAGQSIKHRLELNQIIEDVSVINEAVKEFKANYSSIPGDMWNAETIFGQTTVGNKISDGDGDGNGDGDTTLDDDLATPDRDETLLFWQHLAASGLIEGTYDGSTTGKEGCYEAPMKHSYYTALTDSTKGDTLYFLISRVLNNIAGNGLLSAKESFDIDSKYDDGIPNTGIIIANDGTDQTTEDCVTSAGQYNLSNSKDNACILMFYTQ